MIQTKEAINKTNKETTNKTNKFVHVILSKAKYLKKTYQTI